MAEKKSESKEVALAPARLPWNEGIGARFGIDRDAWRALTDAVFPSAKTTAAVELALQYCKARKLDPFKHTVHVVPIWSRESNAYIETVWPGVAEHRTTAFRTGQYAGADPTSFGPMLEKTFEGTTKQGAQKVTVRFPEWAQVTVHRLMGNQPCPFPGPRVFWMETYSHLGKTELPNDMWQKRPSGQLEKCAEAAALRKAFPEELGGELTADEAGGLEVEPPRDVTPPKPERKDFKASETPHDPQTGEIIPPNGKLVEPTEANPFGFPEGDGGAGQPELGVMVPAADAPADVVADHEYDRAETQARAYITKILAATDPNRITESLISNKARIEAWPLDIKTVVYEQAAKRKATLTKDAIA